ncbi:MAG: NUDIX hydrolase [Lentisphaerales bacterium]|nr:NUDIX hydrolase [Lentisphaerales bacterium]
MSSLNKWQLSSSKVIFHSKIFTIESHWATNPRNGVSDEFYSAKFPDWVNVIALTPEEEVLLIRHFRHGTRKFEIEVPGGCIDKGENPLHAAVRELAEETGYSGDLPILLGQLSPNPSLQDNSCYTVLINNCQQTQAMNLDDGEDIEVFKVSLAEVKDLIFNGKISNTMVVSAFYFLQNMS